MRRARDARCRSRERRDHSVAAPRLPATGQGLRWTVSALRSELVGLLRQIVGEIDRDLPRFVLVEQVLHHKLGEVSAIDAPRYIMPRRDRTERARVVVEADRVVEAGGLGGQLAEAPHAFW